MRFWWRAINGNSDIGKLKKAESKIFGSIDRKSKVNIRIENIKNNPKSYENLIKEIKKYHGIQYNFYPIFMRNKGKFYFETLTFDLIIFSNDEKALEEAINSLIFLNFFGGLGSRSRRGAGSIQIKVKENKNKLFEKKLNLLNTNKIQNKEQFQQHINRLIEQIKPTSSNFYTTFYKSIYIFDAKNDWKNALNTTAYPFKTFRDRNKSRVLETPNFGFPIRHSSGDTFIGGRVKENNKAFDLSERRASPLIFKVFRTRNNVYIPILIWLDGDLLPSKEHKVIKKNNPKENKKPNESIINRFISGFNQKYYLKVRKNG